MDLLSKLTDLGKENNKTSYLDQAETEYKTLKHMALMLINNIDNAYENLDTLDTDDLTENIKKIQAILKLLNKHNTDFYVSAKKHIEKIKTDHFKLKAGQ